MKIATPRSPILPMDMNSLFIYLIEGFCTFFFKEKIIQLNQWQAYKKCVGIRITEMQYCKKIVR